MQPQNTSCQGYWVKLIYVGDYTHSDAYKCMTQTEYDAYQAKIYQQQHTGDWIVVPLIVGILLLVFGTVALLAWMEKRK